MNPAKLQSSFNLRKMYFGNLQSTFSSKLTQIMFPESFLLYLNTNDLYEFNIYFKIIHNYFRFFDQKIILSEF